jgi:hypothetical protein
MPKWKKKTAFVPRFVFATACIGSTVVPACVGACGGQVEWDADAQGYGVAVAFREASYFDVAAPFEAGFTYEDASFDVAAPFDVGTPFRDAPYDITVPLDVGTPFQDAPFGVADVGFGDSSHDAPDDVGTEEG